jgi:purine-binding chemotaxis protein CheW
MDELLIFRIPSGLYAISINYVKEIIFLQEVTPIPNSAKSVLGITRLRDQIIIVFDLAKFYDMEWEEGDKEKNVVILSSQLEKSTFGMLVGQVYDVRGFDDSEVERLPGNISSSVYSKGVIRTKKGLIISISIDEIIKEVFGLQGF